MPKNRLDRLTSRWVINAWQVTVSPRLDLNWTSIRKACPSTEKECSSTGNARNWKKEKVFCISQPDLDREGVID